MVNTKSGTCSFIKGRDELPNWIIATDSQHDNSEEGSVQSLIRDWEDGTNCMFSIELGSPQEVVFKILNVGHILRTHRSFLPLQLQI